MPTRLEAPLAISALEMAGRSGGRPRARMVHSDRGGRFASAEHEQPLVTHHLLSSMSRKGNGYDHAHIESIRSSLEHDLVCHHRFATQAGARAAIFEYIACFLIAPVCISILATSSPPGSSPPPPG